jgi:hypothetical protein
MKQHKIFLDLLDWDSASDKDERVRKNSKDSHTTINKSSNLNCSAALSDYKEIKINSLNISKLAYNSTVTQYNNWLANLKTDFDRDSARFSTSHQKIILVLITLDK